MLLLFLFSWGFSMSVLDDKVDRLVDVDAPKLHALIHGTNTQTVETESGSQPTFAKVIKDRLDAVTAQAQTAATNKSLAQTQASEAATQESTAGTAASNTTSKLTLSQALTTDVASKLSTGSSNITSANTLTSTASTDKDTATTKASEATTSASTASVLPATAAANATTATNAAATAAAKIPEAVYSAAKTAANYARSHVVPDNRIAEVSTSTGYNDFQLLGAMDLCRTITSVVATDEWFQYRITGLTSTNTISGQWEEGWGFVRNGYLYRVMTTSSSFNRNGGFINFSAGVKVVNLIKRLADNSTIELPIRCSDDVNTALTTGVQGFLRVSQSYQIVGIVGRLDTPSTTGNVTFDVTVNGTSILSQAVIIEPTKALSTLSATQPTITDIELYSDDEILVNVTGAGTGAKGFGVRLLLRLMPANYMVDITKIFSAYDIASTTTRNSLAWYFNSSGVLTQAAVNEGRVDFDPVTLALKGSLQEHSSTNYVRNNTMVGAVVGDETNLITNGGFATDLSGWTSANTGSGTNSWNATYQCVQFVSTVTAEPGGLDQVLTTVVGRTYTIKAYVRPESTAAGFMTVGNSAGGSALGSANGVIGQYLTITFTATQTSTYVRIRNSTAAGVSGTTYMDDVQCVWSGQFPNYWTTLTPGVIASLVGSGTEDGIEYVDVHLSGTPSAAAFGIYFEQNTGIPAALNDSWTLSTFLKLQAGSQTNISKVSLIFDARTASTYVNSVDGSALTLTNAKLSSQRYSVSGSLTGAGTAYMVPFLKLAVTAGQAIDITIRVGLPQAEKLAYATSPVKTTGVGTVTRSGDVSAYPVSSETKWFSSAEGAVVMDAMVTISPTIAVSGGLFSMGDGTADFNNRNSIYINVNTSNQTLYAQGVAGVAQNANNIMPTTGFTVGTNKRVGFTYALNNTVCVNEGTLGTTDVDNTIPVVNALAFGNLSYGWSGGTNQGCFAFKEARYYNKRVSNTRLARIGK